MTDGSVSLLSPFQAYKVRELPWGETCAQSEKRLSDRQLRPRWKKRALKLEELGVEYYEACYQAHLEHSPELCEEMLDGDDLSDDDKRFVDECRAGLRLTLPPRVGIDKELDWVGANLWKNVPDVQKAPSLTAINMLIDARTDQGARRTFWSTCLSKRLSPGDTSNKKSKAALKEDAGEVEDAEVDLEDVMKRLGMGE